MTIRNSPYILVAVGLLLCCAPLHAGDKTGETVQRVAIRTLAMPVTRVDSVSVKDLKIADFLIGPDFRINKAPKAPFVILDTDNERLDSGDHVPIDNGVVLVRVAFRPKVLGSFRDTIILRRELPISQTRDEIIIIVEGFAFVPARTIHTDFGGVIVGNTATRLVRFLPDVAVASTWKILRPDPPFSVSDSIRFVPDPDKPGDSVHAFVLRFAPVVKGPKKGQVTFIRLRFAENVIRVIDTLIVTMSGNGEEILPRTTIPFIRLMVGDSAVRGVEESIREIGNTSYKPKYQPSGISPFRLHKYDERNDRLFIEASYAPRNPVNEPPFGDRDSIVFYRYSNRGEPLDSLVCTLSGAAAEMQKTTSISYTDQRIGKLDSADVQLTIPVKFDIRSFSYQLTPARTPTAYTSARIIEPERMPSRESTIIVRVFNTPEAVGAFSDTLYLVRTRNDTTATDTTEIAADTTEIFVSSEVKPRTVKLHASIARETVGANNEVVYSDDPVMTARIGDTIVVVVRANTSDPIDVPLTLTALRCSLAYNPTVLVPIATTTDSSIIVDDGAVFEFGSADPTAQPINTSGRVLARASFVVVMGDADYSALNMIGLTLEPRDFLDAPEFDSATVRITNVWSYQDGRSRLINPFQKNLGLDVSPNPVPSASTSTIRILNVPPGVGSLQVVSSEGVIMADYTAALRTSNGQGGYSTEFGFPTLPRGVYFVRLMAKVEQDGSAIATLNSVVRLVIVE